MFQDQWYVPQGESCWALFLKDAQRIIYERHKVLKCILAFEVILEKSATSRILDCPGDFSLKTNERQQSTLLEFESFKNKKVYSYALNKGQKGILYLNGLPPSGLGFKRFDKDFSSRISTKTTLSEIRIN
jgi:iron complex transport system substrate-binding protein